MLERVRRDWWIPAPLLLIGYGIYVTLTHLVGDGSEPPGSRPAWGWDPSFAERVGSVVLLSVLFVALPTYALAVRRDHPGATIALLTPYGLMSLVPLTWGDAGSMVFPVLGILTFVGALANLSRGPI